jgi:hypothetical protein
MGILTGDYGHEERYVGGAAANNGKYNPDKHVAAQIKDSEEKNKGKGGKSTVGKVLDAVARLGR